VLNVARGISCATLAVDVYGDFCASPRHRRAEQTTIAAMSQPELSDRRAAPVAVARPLFQNLKPNLVRLSFFADAVGLGSSSETRFANRDRGGDYFADK
jgi:hypothetical protein